LFLIVLLGLAVPIQAPAIPLFIALATFDLLDTFFALMFPFFLSVFAIFLFRQAFKTFPDDIVLAARLDGMKEWEILWRVATPSIKPQIAAFAVFSFVAHWNDLYWPLIVVTSPDMVTPPLGMAQFSDPETGTNFGALMAAATVMVIPVVLFFAVMQRHFMESVTQSGIK
jgi:multiple sugar transport system permease protein